MKPYVDNPFVIGADLRNEPRGLWGTIPWSKWAVAAEQASEALLAMQPDWLMFVEGVSSASDCSGASTRPVQLTLPNDLSIPRTSTAGAAGARSQPNTNGSMIPSRQTWIAIGGSLLQGNIAPVWVGEFDVSHDVDPGEQHYWDNLMGYPKDADADIGYWALNPRKPLN
ncbi:hypothetical protein LTR95_004904 [Oleoguttula sp. CCFEE 5521]